MTSRSAANWASVIGERYTSQVILAVRSLLRVSTILFVGMAVSLIHPLTRKLLTGPFFLVLVSFWMASLIRAAYHGYLQAKLVIFVCHPPYDTHSFRNRDDFLATQFPQTTRVKKATYSTLAVFLIMVIWAIIGWVLIQNSSHIEDLLAYIFNRASKESVRISTSILASFLGFGWSPTITSQFSIRSMITTVSWLSQILFTSILCWNILYIFEIAFQDKKSDEGNLNDVLNEAQVLTQEFGSGIFRVVKSKLPTLVLEAIILFFFVGLLSLIAENLSAVV